MPGDPVNLTPEQLETLVEAARLRGNIEHNMRRSPCLVHDRGELFREYDGIKPHLEELRGIAVADKLLTYFEDNDRYRSRSVSRG